jgi:D-threonate/D-erythronate kinase
MSDKNPKCPKVFVIADDLTGACDTALEFYLAGLTTRVEIAEKCKPNSTQEEVLSVSTESRNTTGDAAIQKINVFLANALSRNVTKPLLYKKVDSTMRGHIALESITIVERQGFECALIAPAFPQQQRQTINGHQLLYNTPINNSTTGTSSPSTSHVPSMLGRVLGKRVIGHLTLQDLEKDTDTIIRKIKYFIQQGNRLIVCDAANPQDLRKIADTINKCQQSILPVGSGGLARALCDTWFRDTKPATKKQELPDCPTVIISGSTTEISFTQTRLLIKELNNSSQPYELIRLQPKELLQADSLSLTLKRIHNAIFSQKTIIITTALGDSDVRNTYTHAKQLGLNKASVNSLIQQTILVLVREIASKITAKTIVCGGATIRSMLDAIDTHSLIVKNVVEPSVPLLQTVTPENRCWWIISKSGGFGDPNTLLRSFHYLKH